ncbi:2-aminomuconic semialdehyde dehydrogenase-like [Littorina saxatilis]|uniref:Aldehyde dehydrogenase domain-containing protein n=1 Tax=Littorina saxatilis TaxID=31220 RepID=A0AAN9G240_9CAEN
MGSSVGDKTDLLFVKNFIGGEFVDCDSQLDSFDPSTGQAWAKIPNSGHREVENAVTAATQAFESWSNTTAQQRSKLLFRIADLLESRLEEFAELESRDQGKPIWLAKAVDIPRAVHNFRFFASYILHDMNRSRIQEERGAVQYTIKEPIGVAGLISPWNLPLYLLTFKLAPALAAGNTVVAKPSELTSVTAFKLCEIMQEAGVPAGVVNMVFGLGGTAGHSLVSHPKVPLISFTGGTVTAERIRKAATVSCKKFSLELGGKNAAVVFEDADLDKCIPDCIKSSFMNQGEICLCTSRIFVHKDIYPTFLQRFVEEMKKLKVGDPREDVFMGALISKDHLSKVVGAIHAAKNSGGTIHTQQGELSKELPVRCKEGYFVRPTVISDVADSSAAMQEEIFGPVTCVVPFDTEEEVISRANGVRYGLCATVWTRDVSRAHRVSKHMKVGTVWVNCWLVRDLNMPFGGVKESGIGRESGHDSLDFFTQEKTVCVLV